MAGRFSLLAVGVLMLAACDAVPTPSEPLALEPRYAATTATINIFEPFAQTNFVPCANGGAGEDVLLSGILHVQAHATVSNSGNVVARTHFQPQGVTGVGQTTGDVYRAVGITQETAHGTGTFTYVNNFRLIGPGTDNDFHVKQTIHVTVDANGNVTAVVDSTTTTCS